MALLVGIIWRQLNTVDLGQPPEQHARTAGLHEAIVHAVAARDPVAARRAMLDHLETTRQGLSNVPGSLGGLIQNLYMP